MTAAERREEFAYSLCRSLYAESLGFAVYPWQQAHLDSRRKRRCVDAARQGGKSLTTALIPTHTAKYEPGSLSIVTAATERQAGLDMKKILEFISKDGRYPKITRSSDDLIQLANKSEIVVVPATEKSARGDTRPRVIIVDEAGWVPDRVIRSGIRPMLNNNRLCELILCSTPNGRQGFFYRAFGTASYERFLVISPFEVDDAAWLLVDDVPEPEFQAKWAAKGIRAWYSPEHGYVPPRPALSAEDAKDAQMRALYEKLLEDDERKRAEGKKDQQESLDDVGPTDYRQEYRGEFVEREGQVFGYDDIDAMMAGSTEPAVEPGELDTVDEPALEAAV